MRKIASVMVLVMLFTMTSGCAKKKVNTEKTELNVLIMGEDPYGRDIRKQLIEAFNDEYDYYEVKTYEDMTKDDIVTDINRGKLDIIFCTPRVMRDLEKEGLLANLNNIYYKRNLFERTYSAMNTYGRIQNLFYGFPLYASTFEIFYNIDMMKDIGVDPQNDNIEELMGKCTKAGVTVPIIDRNDNPYSFILGVMMANYVYLNNFDIHKGELVYAFDKYKTRYDKNVLNAKNFSSGGKKEFEKFLGEEIPIIIANSNVIPQFQNKNIGIWDNYKIEDYWITPPAYLDSVVSFPVITNNEKGQKEFIRYFTSNNYLKWQEELEQLTHDSNVNKDLGGMNLFVTKHLETASQNGIIYNQFLKSGMEKDLRNLLKEVLSGGVTREEMQEKLNTILYKRRY